MAHRFKRGAAQEFLETIKYYENERYGLGAEFLDEINRSIATIEEAPMRWAEVDAGVRRYRLDRFPYHIFYRIQHDAVVICAVAHQHRMPGYWKDRLG